MHLIQFYFSLVAKIIKKIMIKICKIFHMNPNQLSYLDEKESRVLELRFGLNGNEHHTHMEIGKKMNISRERVRMIEQSALQSLKSKSDCRDKSLKESISDEILNSLTESIRVCVSRDDFLKARYSRFSSFPVKTNNDINEWVLHIIEIAQKHKNLINNIADLLEEGVIGLGKAVSFYNKISEEGVSDNAAITQLVLKEKKFENFARLVIENHISKITNSKL